MSSKFPTNVNFSLREFSLRGGGTGPHSDGWGIAYGMEREFRIVKEPEAAVDSDCVIYIEAHRFQSSIVISHIRQASPGLAPAFENTHPFDRELQGRRIVFAHNGFVDSPETLPGFGEGRYRPMGETDSEKVFCYFLNAIDARIQQGVEYHFRMVEEVLRELSPALRERGKFNFLLADSETLFAHGDSSLFSQCRSCHLEEHRLDSETLGVLLAHGPDQEAAVVATQPLSEPALWEPFQAGEIRVFRGGRRI